MSSKKPSGNSANNSNASSGDATPNVVKIKPNPFYQSRNEINYLMDYCVDMDWDLKVVLCDWFSGFVANGMNQESPDVIANHSYVFKSMIKMIDQLYKEYVPSNERYNLESQRNKISFDPPSEN